MNQQTQVHLTIQHLIETWNQLSECLKKDPNKLIESQANYLDAYFKLCEEFKLGAESTAKENDSIDKRFNYKEWQENLSFNFIKRSYLLLSEHIGHLIKNVTAEAEPKVASKLQFYTRQFINAASPTNFAHLNPEILSKTLETNSINLMVGMRQFLEDLENGELNIKYTDYDLFKLGDNIACTPGKVIYQNDLMQLIQYNATSKNIYQYPLLIVPPWINKYYILDLQQDNSLVKWLVDQGFTVFVISWVNATPEQKDKQFVDYMLEGPLTALKQIEQITGEAKTNLLGYCIGGTLLGCMLAYLAKKNDTRINSATFLAALFDFSEPGELGTFVDNEQLSMLEQYMKTKGYLDGRIMASVFNALRANDLIWSVFINNYLKGQKPKPFDLLYWNYDSTNIPQHVHCFYLRNMYLENRLIKPNQITLDGVSLDLSTIKVPGYFLAAEEDHIVPWRSAYKSTQFYGGQVKFVLTTSGHVAGIVNPPHKMKYGYWLDQKQDAKNPENFLSSATFTQGSWWNDWVEWLKKYSGNLQKVDSLKIDKQTIIENAPGSYVKVRA